MVKHTLEFDAILFDMDGTLLNSTPAVNQVWLQFAKTYNLDLDSMLASSHGVQTHMTFRKYLPPMSEEALKAEVQKFEAGIIPTAAALAKEGKEGLVVLPGVTRLLGELRTAASEGSRERFAIVTSATAAYGLAALDMLSAGLGPLPKVVITADDVSKGKPNPDPYLEGARRMGVDPSRCLVVEDAPSGAKSGLAAGCKVLGVGTGHDGAALRAANPTFYVEDLTTVSATFEDGKFLVTIKERD